jgi:hypothetical protein
MDEFIDRMSSSFQNELQKIAGVRVKTGSILTSKYVLGPVAGIAAWEGLKKVEKDRRLGREIRRRQQGGF